MLDFNGNEPKKIRFNNHNVAKVVYNNNIVWKGLPSSYTRLEYIESTGEQYIDTGIKSGSNVKIKSSFASTIMADARNYVFGVYNQSRERMQYSYSLETFLGYGDKYISKQFNIDTNKHIIQLYSGIFTLDDNIIQTISTNAFKSSSRNIFLFAVNSNAGNMSYSYIKMYLTQIWENNTLVRNFIPARRNSDNEVGLYDTVTDTFYTNQGTGSFVAGEYNQAT